MIDALPFALVAVCASNPILSLFIFCKIPDTMLTDLTEGRTISTVVEIAGNQNKCPSVQALDRINRLTKTICYNLTERAAIALSPIAARRMNHKDMKCVAREYFTTSIENISGGTHTFYRGNTDGITVDRGERER